jgi:hypothetical protein
MMVLGVASAPRTHTHEEPAHGNHCTQQLKRARTVRAAELRDGVDEAFMELDGPPEAGLGVGGEDQARVGLHAHLPII